MFAKLAGHAVAVALAIVLFVGANVAIDWAEANWDSVVFAAKWLGVVAFVAFVGGFLSAAFEDLMGVRDGKAGSDSGNDERQCP